MHCHQPGNEVTGEHRVSPVCRTEGHSTILTALDIQWDYLAANGRYDLWSLCDQKFSSGTVIRRVAYNVDKTKPNQSFDVDTCVPVYLTLV